MIPCDAQVPWSVSSHSRLWKIHIKQEKMLYSLIFNVYMSSRYLRKENISRNEGEQGWVRLTWVWILPSPTGCGELPNLSESRFPHQGTRAMAVPVSGWLVSCVSYSIGPSREGSHLGDSRPPPVLSHFHTLCSGRTFCWRGCILGAQPGARHL